jgi:flagellar biosynthesis protein FlhF
VHARDDVGIATLTQICAAVPALIGMLVLPASAQTAVIEDTLTRLASLSPVCAMLTRIDEAAAFGGALAALIRARLPVALVSDGPRIPEDLRAARADELVAAAIEAGRATHEQPEEDLLARRFGGMLNAAA